MRALRRLCGILSLLGLAVALNLLVLSTDPFLPAVLISVSVALGGGLLWALLAVLTATRGKDERYSLQGLNSIVASAVVFGICVVIYAFAARGGQSWDLTKEGRRDLAPQTIQVLQNLDEDVNVYGLFPGGDTLVAVAKEKTQRFLERCQRHSAHLKTQYIDPHMQPMVLEKFSLQAIPTQGAVILESGVGKRIIPLSGGSPRLEERDFTNSLINVLRASRPKVCFLTGHQERDILSKDPTTGAGKFAELLDGEGYDIDRTAIVLSDPEVAADCDILVINQPGTDLYPADIAAIQAYLDRGGRLLLLVEPGYMPGGGRGKMYDWLAERYGIVVGEDLVLSTVMARPGVLQLVPDSATVDIFERFGARDVDFQGCFETTHPITKNFAATLYIEAARSVQLATEMPSDVAGVSLLRTLPYAWAETNLQGIVEKAPGAAPKPDEDETAGSISLAVAVTAKTDEMIGDSGVTRDARIIVVGDAGMTSDALIGAYGNQDFLMNTMAWLSQNEQLIAIRPVREQEQAIYLSGDQEKLIAWISSLGIMQFIIAAGLVTFALRRKYQ